MKIIISLITLQAINAVLSIVIGAFYSGYECGKFINGEGSEFISIQVWLIINGIFSIILVIEVLLYLFEKISAFILEIAGGLVFTIWTLLATICLFLYYVDCMTFAALWGTTLYVVIYNWFIIVVGKCYLPDDD